MIIEKLPNRNKKRHNVFPEVKRTNVHAGNMKTYYDITVSSSNIFVGKPSKLETFYTN